jgi:hypothetical protein
MNSMVLKELPNLPNEVWINVLGNLKIEDLFNVSLVSKKARELALDPLLWTELDLCEGYKDGHSDPKRLSVSRCEALFARCNHLRTLKIISTDEDRGAVIEALLENAIRNCKKIVRIEINHDYEYGTEPFSMGLFQKFEEHGVNIRELDFSIADYINRDNLLLMPTLLGRLTSLRLSHCLDRGNGSNFGIVPGVLQTLGSHCSSLRHLNLEYYFMYENEVAYAEDLWALFKDDIEALLSATMTSLVSLKIDNLFEKRRDALQDAQSPFVHCPMLEKLYVGRGIDVKDIKAIGQLEHLKVLKIWASTYLDDDEDYQHVYLEDEDYQNAFEQKQLINLQHFSLISSDTDVKFGKKSLIALLQNCPLLTSVSCAIHDIQGLREVVAHALNLQMLEIDVRRLDRNEFIALTSLCNLRVLKISGFGANSVCNVKMRTLPRGNLVNLEVLTLNKCRNLDSKMFKALVEGSPKLQEVNLDRLPEVSRCAEIFKECGLKNLETFRAEKCPLLQGTGVAALLKSCPKLKTFSLVDTEEEWTDTEEEWT